jgi:hypothetical protein
VGMDCTRAYFMWMQYVYNLGAKVDISQLIKLISSNSVYIK